jgi:hypothetical protein
MPEKGGVRVITEESQKGADAIAFRQTQPNAMYDGHDWWLSALKARAKRTAHSPAAAANQIRFVPFDQVEPWARFSVEQLSLTQKDALSL